MQINIDVDRMVLPCYHEFLLDQKYYSILRGGRGSGKSRAICQKIILRCLTEKNHLFVIIRNKMTDHTNSTYREFKEVIHQFGIGHLAKFYTAPAKIKIQDHSEIIFLGMDDPQRLKGLSGVTGLWFEEISEIEDLASFEEVMSGFRPNKSHYRQVYMSFNPVSQDHWMKKRFFDENPDADRTFHLKTTHQDNPYLPIETVTSLLNLRYVDENMYKVNVLGEWGSLQTGNEYYKNFSYAQHVDENDLVCNYNPNLPLHISFDFNVLPHTTLMVFQIVGRQVRVIDELIAKSPRVIYAFDFPQEL